VERIIRLALRPLYQPVKDVTKHLAITHIPLEADNEMIRIGGGFNKGRGFVRVDLWRDAYRVTRK